MMIPLEEHDTAPAWVSVSTDMPCPICGQPNLCSILPNEFIACRRFSEGGDRNSWPSGEPYWVHPWPDELIDWALDFDGPDDYEEWLLDVADELLYCPRCRRKVEFHVESGLLIVECPEGHNVAHAWKSDERFPKTKIPFFSRPELEVGGRMNRSPWKLVAAS